MMPSYNIESECLTTRSSKYDFIVADSLEKIEAIRPFCEFLQRKYSAVAHPNNDMDRYLSFCDDVAQPYILLLHREGRPDAMLFCQKGTVSVECKIGYLKLFKPSLKGLSIMYRGFLGQDTPEVCHKYIEKLNQLLDNGEYDVMEFIHLPTDSQMYRAARAKPGMLRRGYFPKIAPHWQMVIPRNIDLYYKSLSKKHRYNLKRSIKMLENQHKVRVAEYRSEEDLNEAISLAAKVSLKTYQYGLGWGFIDNADVRKQLTVLAQRNWLRFHVLFIDDKPCAFQWGFQYQNTYFPVQRGYDSDWKSLSIGTTLFLKVLEELCQDCGVDHFDLDYGDDDFKYLYGEMTKWPEASIYIYSTRLYPLFVNFISSLTRGLTLGSVSVLRKTGLEYRVKKTFRKLLQTSNLLFCFSSFFYICEPVTILEIII